MNRLIALLSFVLALFGVEVDGQRIDHTRRVDGVEILHSRTRVQHGTALFECMRSASGRCYYTVLPARCAARPSTPCRAPALERFVLETGDSRQFAGLQRFDVCVHTQASRSEAACAPPDLVAMR